MNPIFLTRKVKGCRERTARLALTSALLAVLLAACMTGPGSGGMAPEATTRPLPANTFPAATATAAPSQTATATTRNTPTPLATSLPAIPEPTTALTATATAAPPPLAPATLAPALPGTAQGFELVGHQAFSAIGWHAGLALQDDCAYVGNRRSGAAAIVDISDPAAPVQIGAIPFGAGGQPVELRTLPERDLLVVADFGANRLLTFDVGDCAAPVQRAAIELPGAPHEFYLWTDGTQVLVFGAMFDHGGPDLLVFDVTDPSVIREVASWSAEQAGVAGLLHSLSVSDDGRRAFLAMWNGGVLVAELALPEVRILRDSAGRAQPAALAAAHSVVPLPMGGEAAYVLATSEIWGCPFAEAVILSVADPARPYVAARAGLPENRCDNLPAVDASFTPHNPLVAGPLAFISWYGAGLQVLDVGDPLAPRRVAQFVPSGEGAAPASYIGGYPVQTWSYPILRDGYVYVVDIQSGLYVLRYTGPGAEQVVAIRHAEGNVTARR